MRWVNEKMIGGELHTLYRNDKNELVMVVHEVDEKGRKVKDTKTKKPKVNGKENKVNRKTFVWQSQ